MQERIPIRREPFPMVETRPHRVTNRDMLVDCAPYIFRGKVCGFLTRLSASGLANVTSGGGQVPAFRVGADCARADAWNAISTFKFRSSNYGSPTYSHIMWCQYGQSCPPCGPQSSRWCGMLR